MKHSALYMVLLFWSCSLFAVENQLGFAIRGGVNAMFYNAQTGGTLPRETFGLDIDYTFLYDYYVGFRLGVAADYAASQFRAVPYADSYLCIDKENDEMQVSYTMTRLTEDHYQFNAAVPVQLALAFGNFNVFLGPKWIFPLYMSRHTKAYNVALQCTYPYYESTVDEALALRAGLQYLQQSSAKETLHPKVWHTLSMEAGYDIYRSNHRQKPYTFRLSVWADVALNKYAIPKTANISVISLTDTRDGIPVDRVLESVLRSNRGNTALVQDYRYFSCGVKATFLITQGTRKRKCKICFL